MVGQQQGAFFVVGLQQPQLPCSPGRYLGCVDAAAYVDASGFVCMRLTRAAVCCLCLQTPQLLRSVGRYLARVDAALVDFSHPGIRLTHDWAIERVLDAIQQFSHLLLDDTKR
jgi:hypothetical protein